VKNKIILTGSSGFLGSAIYRSLGHRNIALLGRKNLFKESLFFKKQLSGYEDYSDCFASVETIIHCAARVHIMDDKTLDPLSDFREVNTAGTLNLARQAAASGVKRFIFISSIKVNGETTSRGTEFTSDDEAKPRDPYGISKAEAEAGLLGVAKETGLEVVIIRPTLVYGPGVKGNFLNLLKLSNLSVPLPFGSINNKRSMVYLDNLVDLIITCIEHPRAAGKIFLASDGDDLSLARLLGLIRKSMNKRPLLIPIPSMFFMLIGKIIGKGEVIDRLVGNLQVDSRDAKNYLSWTPPYSVEQGIKATVDDFINKSLK